MGVDDVKVGWFANYPGNLTGDDLAKVLALGNDMLDAVKTDFLIGCRDKVERLTELVPVELFGGSEHTGDRAFHVAAATSVQSIIVHSRLKWPKFISKPAGDRNNVRVAKVGEASVSAWTFLRRCVALAGDEVHFDNTGRIAISQFLDEKAELGQLHLQVLGNDSVRLMADRLQPNHSLCVSESFHVGARGRCSVRNKLSIRIFCTTVAVYWKRVRF